MKKAIFFSGPHGSGKTTLIKRLIEETHSGICFRENVLDINFLSEFPSIKLMNDFERCLLRFYHRSFVANYVLSDFPVMQKNTCTLVSRSIYDSYAYIDVYQKLGRFATNEQKILSDVLDGNSITPYTVILNPPIDIIMQRLKKRSDMHERDDRKQVFSNEDSLEFVTALHNSFEKMKNYDNVLYIENNEMKDISRIIGWVLK